MSAWAVRRAGSAPRAHALGAARATVGARHVLLALADARVLNRAQSGDLQEKGSRRKCWGHSTELWVEPSRVGVTTTSRVACTGKDTAAAPVCRDSASGLTPVRPCPLLGCCKLLRPASLAATATRGHGAETETENQAQRRIGTVRSSVMHGHHSLARARGKGGQRGGLTPCRRWLQPASPQVGAFPFLPV